MELGGESQKRDPRASAPYLEAIRCYFKEFDQWLTRCDRIDRIYSGMESLSGVRLDSVSRVVDREYDLYWASVQVMLPAAYSRPPVPVVTPKFKDRSAVKRVTSELLERSSISGFEYTNINSTMLSVRDDLILNARGQVWVSYEDDGREKVCIESLDRDDFAHDPVRKWDEVGWVARQAWLTRDEMKERFGDEFAMVATYTERKEKHRVEGVKETVHKCAVWEFWDKEDKKVVWVSE